MRAKVGIVLASLGFVCAAAPAVAHHSFAAEYDAQKPLDVKGVVSKIEWTNPHAWFYVDVTDANGAVSTWNFELASPNALVRNGWTRKSLNIGDRVSVKGYGAKSGAKMASASEVVLADGRKVFAGSG